MCCDAVNVYYSPHSFCHLLNLFCEYHWQEHVVVLEFYHKAQIVSHGDSLADQLISIHGKLRGLVSKKGASESYLVRDKTTGKLYIFKPSASEAAVPRAQERGIAKGDYAPRAKAGEMTAEQLGLATPKVDLVVLSGDPLSYKTHVLETWVEGQKVFDRSDPKDRLYATGGYGASHDQSPFAHSDGDDEEGR